MNPLTRVLLPLLCLTAAIATPSHSAVITYDFESLSGDINGVDGWSVERSNTTATVLTTGGLSYSSGGIVIDGGNHLLSLSVPMGDVNNALAKNFTLGGQGNGSTVYFSFLYQTPGVNQFLISGLANGPDMRDSSAVLVDRSDDQARLYDAAQASSATDLTTGDLPTTTTQFVVGRVTFDATGNEVFELAINPSSLDETTAFTGATTVSHDIGITAFDQFGVLANANNNGTHLYDEIRIANSYAEVIPEPSATTLLLGGLGVLVLLRRRLQRA